jgi:hypothetical protein
MKSVGTDSLGPSVLRGAPTTRTFPVMAGFKSFDNAAIIIAGIEPAHLDCLLCQIGDEAKPALLTGVIRRQRAQSFLFLNDDRYLIARQRQKCFDALICLRMFACASSARPYAGKTITRE